MGDGRMAGTLALAGNSGGLLKLAALLLAAF